MTGWWRCLASHLTFVSETIVVSEFRNTGDVYVMPQFYRFLKENDNEAVALAAFGEAGCEEIRLRCRFLRQFERSSALTMIGAMFRAQSEIIDEHCPDIALSLCIDYYPVDILDRILQERGIRYIGLSAAPISGQALVTARGEHNHVREPSVDEVAEAYAEITSSNFSPFLPSRPKYDRYHFAKKWAYFTARAPALRALGLWQRDPLNAHYWLARPNFGSRIRLRDFGVVKHFVPDWDRIAEDFPQEKRLFLALGVYPESTIDYWVRSPTLLDYHATLMDVVTTFSDAGFLVLVKDHPNMFGFQSKELVERLNSVKNVVFVSYDVPSRSIMEKVRCTFTLAGTVGMQAALAGRISIVTDPYYFVEGAFIQLKSREGIHSLPQRVGEFVPQRGPAAGHEIVRQVLRTCIPGDLPGSSREFDNLKTGGPLIAELSASINEYVPGLIRT